MDDKNDRKIIQEVYNYRKFMNIKGEVIVQIVKEALKINGIRIIGEI